MTERYPSEGELLTIRMWKWDDLDGLMDFIRGIWAYADWGWKQEGGTYNISTGGWSGNEDVIEAMESNRMWWANYWHSSRRGGHYIFCARGMQVNP
jgi:hypothetical protein